MALLVVVEIKQERTRKVRHHHYTVVGLIIGVNIQAHLDFKDEVSRHPHSTDPLYWPMLNCVPGL